MKKLIAVCLTCAVAVWTFGPIFAGATIDTSLNKDAAGGANPIIKVKWEMYPTSNGLNGRDDGTTAGAQFKSSGIYGQNTTIQVCAIVTDPDGVSDIDAVYADVWYPEGIWAGPVHPTLGCGVMHGNEFTLTKLTKQVGIDLFCTEIQSENNNLPVWKPEGSYDYDEICATDGELMKETAYVYCGSKTLSYEDPSGSYRVQVLTQDKNGLNGTLDNNFTYLDTTAYEVDFLAIAYGNVKLNTHKIINGDLTWDATAGTNKASVRNVGNTRISMQVKQNDMGLGMTDTSWNVGYDGRVGSDATFVTYAPNVWRTLNLPLNLSELDEMDFSIDVYKFPNTGGTSFTGNMELQSIKATHQDCAQHSG